LPDGEKMKFVIIIGILLGLLGAVIVFRGIPYPSEGNVVNLGGFQASVEEHRDIPAWIGGIAIAGGMAMVVAGLSPRLLKRKP
jgi:hypothetical protein